MHFQVILRITGILLMLFSVVMLTPIIVASLYAEDTAPPFLMAFAITLVTGLVLVLFTRRGELRSRDGFMVTALFYLGLGLFGALPLHLDADWTRSNSVSTIGSSICLMFAVAVGSAPLQSVSSTSEKMRYVNQGHADESILLKIWEF